METAMKMEWVEITPKWAAALLKRNREDQRFLRKARVARLGMDLREDRWLPTHQAVGIDDEGWVVDGQHRLNAIVKTGKPMWTWICYDVPASSFPAIDIGLARSFRDLIHEQHGAVAAVVSGLTRRVIAWENGNYVGRYSGYSETNEVYRGVTNPELIERYQEAKEELIRSAERGREVSTARLGGGAAIAAMAYWLFTHIPMRDDDDEPMMDDSGQPIIDMMARTQADEFFDKLVTGENLTAGSPILVLRNRLIKLAGPNSVSRGTAVREGTPRGRKEKIWHYEVLALYIRAWNFYRAGLKIGQLQVSRNGLSNDTFPQPR